MGKNRIEKITTRDKTYTGKIKHLVELTEYGNNVDNKNEIEVKQAITWYFNKCIQDELPCTPEGLGATLGCSRRTLYKWLNGDGNRTFETRHSIRQALDIIGNLTVYDAIDGKISTGLAIFLLTNNHGYEKDSYASNSQVTISVAVAPEKLEEKYNSICEADYREIPATNDQQL